MHTHTQSQLTQKYLLILLSFPIFSFPFIGIFLIRCSFTSSNRLCSALYSALKLLYSVLPFLFISYLSSSPPSSLGSMSLSRSHWALSLLVWWRMLHALALFSFILQHFFCSLQFGTAVSLLFVTEHPEPLWSKCEIPTKRWFSSKSLHFSFCPLSFSVFH